MSKQKQTKQTPAHANAAEARDTAEQKAIDAAPPVESRSSLDTLLDLDTAARVPRAMKPRKVSADRGPTFLDEVTALLKEAGRPIKVTALVAYWCDKHPNLGIDCRGAREARDTAAAALDRGDTAEAEAADKRAAEAARKQAEATIGARIYTAMKEGRLGKGGKGEVTAPEVAKVAKVA